MKRNGVVISAVLLLLAAFAGGGWLHFLHQKQVGEGGLSWASKGDPVAVAAAAAEEASPLVGQKAPEFALEDLTGKKVSLSSYRGKAVLVNFWATWCGPCKIETPWLIELKAQYAPQGFEILGVSADDIDRGDAAQLAEEKKQIGRAVRQMGISYPVLIDGQSLSKAYGGLNSLPVSFFIDRNGVVVATQVGLTSKDETEAKVLKALK
jgi:cytochrome c biogenesis protein CcmG/thiol:disulfide interchange protein DsbE